MRKGLWLAGLVLGLLAAREAAAQSTSTWGPKGPLQYKVVNTDASVVPLGNTPAQPSSNFFSNMLTTVTGLFSKSAGPSATPAQSQAPSKNYFGSFGMNRPQRVSP